LGCRLAIDNGIQVLNDPALKAEDKKEERIERLRQVVKPIFDFVEMAKRSLGAHWRRLSPEKRQEFVTLFTEYLEKTYADRVDLYNGHQAVFLSESIDQGYAQVDSKVANKKGEEFSVVYKLRLSDQVWKVYDVVVENISIVNNYRSQFNRVISNSSYDELIKKIKQKSE
jgi:phospholipid transport system substrate-binding protein